MKTFVTLLKIALFGLLILIIYKWLRIAGIISVPIELIEGFLDSSQYDTIRIAFFSGLLLYLILDRKQRIKE